MVRSKRPRTRVVFRKKLELGHQFPTEVTFPVTPLIGEQGTKLKLYTAGRIVPVYIGDRLVQPHGQNTLFICAVCCGCHSL
jgi:hypothetical protein